ncbi:MAG: hypothetical protein IPO27_07035 [Bacteroidetes bacterium]|nr:hypothetical protein [Bacteroidota bacterium]
MKKIIVCMVIVALAATSCKKEPGIGGDASIKGKVYARKYNTTFTNLLSQGYVPDADVYIIFGDDLTYSERIRTNYNGEFEFPHLYKGDYTLYVYSKDSAAIVNQQVLPEDSAVVKKISISERKQEVDAGEMIIFK